MISPPSLGSALHGFFENHLKLQKGLRPNSIKTYRDAIRMLLQFVAAKTRRGLARLTLDDLTPERVEQFLEHLETVRGNHVRSRNNRLTALRVFFEYVGTRNPERLADAQRIISIPVKRTQPPKTSHLEREEVEEILARLPNDDRNGIRDRALLLFLYNTGARVQEAADVCAGHLEFNPGPRVRLHGKGDKWRVCPLWNETAALLKHLLSMPGTHCDANAPVFSSRGGSALTRFGIYKIVRRHAQHLISKSRGTRRVSPHVFRHAAATSLLDAGVDINVIRAWMGHVSLESTNRYTEITIRMKAEAVRLCEPPANRSKTNSRSMSWRTDAELLHWLQSL